MIAGDPIKTDIYCTKCYNIGYMMQNDRKQGNARQARPVPPPVRRAVRQVADNVAAWRKLRGLTQAQLADRSGVGRETLTRLEGGDGGVSLENVLRILRGLGVLDSVPAALDPYASDVGRRRSEERLPQRVRPRRLTGRDDG
jgi:transcriptional regulator with XRE-family HTH domain